MTAADERIWQVEQRLFGALRLEVEHRVVQLPTSGLRLRVLASGGGPPVLLLHGVTQSSAVWAPLLANLSGYRLLAVDLPGHGLSDPTDYTRGHVRAHTLRVLDELLDTLGLEAPAVIGHSLGGMFALWHAAARPDRVGPLILLGAPAGAIPGVRIGMPLSLLNAPVLGEALLRAPTTRATYRALFARAMGGMAAARASNDLVDTLRLAQRRPGNARTVARLMFALNGFRQPRRETVMTDAELRSVQAPSLFVWGRLDPYLSPAAARPYIEMVPRGVLHEVAAGHGPWLETDDACAGLIESHLATAGLAPAHAR